eukprot:COSAG01_NODE_1465_length_10223_cov_4.478961_2_plen_67_part_00
MSDMSSPHACAMRPAHTGQGRFSSSVQYSTALQKTKSPLCHVYEDMTAVISSSAEGPVCWRAGLLL